MREDTGLYVETSKPACVLEETLGDILVGMDMDIDIDISEGFSVINLVGMEVLGY